MYTFLIVLHVIVSLVLILAIIMQSSKGGGLSGTFGGAGGGSLFGQRTAATFLSKMTTGLAVAFMVISILISLISAPRAESGSIVKREADRRVAPAADLSVPAGMLDNEGQPVVPTSE